MTGAESINSSAVSASLPEDIICEILRHCTGSPWSYRELALLCRIDKEWSTLARRTLYQDIRLDYRREVDYLTSAFANAPHTAELVRSIVINGDGAHGPNIYRLLKQAKNIRHIFFFDFELGSTLEEDTLCASIPLHNLTSLSFSVLPAGFVDKVLRVCAENVKSLRIYRVNLAAVDSKPCTGDKPRWPLPNLRALSMKHVGNLPHQVFQELISNTSPHLHCLKIHYETPHELCQDASVWQDCKFKVLERLELDSFTTEVVSRILENSGNPLLSLHTLKLLSLQNPKIIATGEIDSMSPSPEPYRKPLVNILDSLPASLQILEMQACQDPAVCRELPEYLDRYISWLPKLRICPTLTLSENVIKDGEMAVLRVAYFAAARKSGLTLPEGSQYYALKGYTLSR